MSLGSARMRRLTFRITYYYYLLIVPPRYQQQFSPPAYLKLEDPGQQMFNNK